MPNQLWRPMLAAKPDPEHLDTALAAVRYPVLASPKLDGIRATVQQGRLYSRSLKLIPNLEMQTLWGREELNGLDGEIIVGPPTALDCFNRSTSVVMSRNKPATDAVFHVFDCFEDHEFVLRTTHSKAVVVSVQDMLNFTLQDVCHKTLTTQKELLKYEARQLKVGHEGIMLRDPEGIYKQGRSTLKEGGLIAVKRFVDAEAVILDTYEQEENTNEKTINELGRSKRSTHKAGKVGKDTLGGFTVCMRSEFKGRVHLALNALQANPKDERFFNIGTGVGLTDASRKVLWAAHRELLVGQIVKFRYQKIGTMEAPRMPIFLGFRDKKDL